MRGGAVEFWGQTAHNDDDNKSPTTAIAELTALGSSSSSKGAWRGGLQYLAGRQIKNPMTAQNHKQSS